jgi:TonB family protein
LRPVFRVDPRIDEARSEPLCSPPAALPPPLGEASISGPIAEDSATGRREPAPPAAAPAWSPPERAPPIGSRQQTRPFGPLGSALLHLLPLLLLLGWSARPPAAVTPIPVQLVFQPPPAKPSPPQPRPKPEVRPPPGRLASDDIGDTKMRGQAPVKGEAAAAEKPAAARTPPREPEKKTAAAIPPPPTPRASDLANERPVHEPPRPKPKPAVPQPLLRHAAARIHLAPRPAQFPGPAATRDEYLAYLKQLTLKHLNMLTMAMVAGRRGQTVIDILVLDDGTVATLKVGQSSGYPDIDRQIEAMIHAVGRFPPLPQWFQGPAMRLEFRIRFPEALED